MIYAYYAYWRSACKSSPALLYLLSYLAPLLTSIFAVPVGRSGNDGLSYPVNPRFDSNGRWRRRAEWPPELR